MCKCYKCIYNDKNLCNDNKCTTCLQILDNRNIL